MDQKRFILFIVLSMTILIGWGKLEPLFRRPKAQPAAQNAQGENADDRAGDQAPPGDKPQVAGDAAGQAADKKLEVGPAQPDDEVVADEKPRDEKLPEDPAQAAAEKPAEHEPAKKEQPAARALPKFLEQTVELGSGLFQAGQGYRQLVTLTSRGAAVKKIELNDPRYVTLEKPHVPLTVVGDDPLAPGTLEIAVEKLGADLDVRRLNWELVEVLPKLGPHSTALFRLELDDIVIEKRYELPVVNLAEPNPDEAPAYAMKVDLTFRNRGPQERTLKYVLQGPTGLPLENVENTQKYRDVVVGFTTKEGGASIIR